MSKYRASLLDIGEGIRLAHGGEYTRSAVGLNEVCSKKVTSYIDTGFQWLPGFA